MSLPWKRFTERARRVMYFGTQAAKERGSLNVGTEDLFLGLLRESNCAAFLALKWLELHPEDLRTRCQEQMEQGSPIIGDADMKLTQPAKRVIDASYEVSDEIGNNYVACGHLLLAFLRVEDCPAKEILSSTGISYENLKRAVIAVHTEEEERGKANFPGSKEAS